jgi:hypothetical protein
VTPISSATPLYRAVIRLTSQEWLDALVGCDVLSEKLVKAEATGLLLSQPRARQRIGTSSEALWAGPRASRRIGTSSKALRVGPRASRRIGTLSEALWAGPGASQRIGTSSEALWAGPQASRRIGTSSKALRAGPRVSQRIGTLSEALWFHSGLSPLQVSPDIVLGRPGGPAEPRIRWGFAGGCLLALIFTRSKRFFWFLLWGPLFMVPDSSPRASGRV